MSTPAATGTADAWDLMPLNETVCHFPAETRRVETLAASMREDGWRGAPVLTWAGAALTGTHRIAAARLTDTPVDVLDLADLIEDADATVERVAESTGWDSIVAAAALVEVALGKDAAEALGNDIDYDIREVPADLDVSVR